MYVIGRSVIPMHPSLVCEGLYTLLLQDLSYTIMWLPMQLS